MKVAFERGDERFVIRRREDASAASSVLERFDAEGRWTGTLVLPGRLVPRVHPVIRGNRLVAVVEDEMGVQAVVKGWVR